MKSKRIENQLENWSFNPMFSTMSATFKFISAHCIVMWNVLTVTDKNHKQCIFQILPVNGSRSYLIHVNTLCCDGISV